MLPPVALNDTVWPLQIDGVLAEVVIVGLGSTATNTVVTLTHVPSVAAAV